MKVIRKSSIRLWILALFAVGLAVSEISTPLASNLTVWDADQLFNVSCSEDLDCVRIHFAALCKVASIDYDDLRNITLDRQCGCDNEQRFFRRGDTCVFHSPVLGNCDVTQVSSICEDPLSECRPSSDGTGILSCECKFGTVMVEYNSTKKCAYEIDSQDDPACDICIFNKGVCFDLNSDKKRDGCACPPSYSGENCAVENVKVTCSSTEMRICYTPHSDIDVVRGFSMATHGKQHVTSCRARRSDAVCGAGQYLLSLPLQDPLLSVCGTEVIREGGKIRYTSTIMIQTHPEPSRIADRFFHTFCSFSNFHDISSVGMTVNSYTDTEVGQEIRPLLTLSIRNPLGEELHRDRAYRVGDHIYLRFFLSTDNGYTALRVDGCTLSTSDLLPDARAETLRVIHDGCPVPGQRFITNENNFWRVQDQPNELQTGLVQLIMLRSSRSLHIHCTLKLCIRGFDEGCELANCQPSRKKRRSVETEGDSTMVDIHGEIKVQENIKHTGIVGMTLTSIALAVIVFVILVAVVVLVVLQARTIAQQKRRQKAQQVKLVKARSLFLTTLHSKGVPSHMTESEV